MHVCCKKKKNSIKSTGILIYELVGENKGHMAWEADTTNWPFHGRGFLWAKSSPHKAISDYGKKGALA